MRLSEIQGDRVFDVIADVLEPVANIAEDKEAAGLFDRNRPEGMDARTFALKKVRQNAPALIRGHKQDLIDIFSTIKGEDPQAYAQGLTLGGLIKDLYELVTDEDLLGFLS